jgi:DnaJ-class molecular chaperone
MKSEDDYWEKYDHEHDAPTGPTESVICTACNGSGEGAYDGSRCSACRGRGEVEVELNDEREEP